MAGWSEQRRSNRDDLEVTLREELAFLRKFRDHALGRLARLPKRSGASSSLLKPATETNPLGSNEGSRTTTSLTDGQITSTQPKPPAA